MAAQEKTVPVTSHTTVEGESQRDLVVTRSFDRPARILFDAWTKPALLKQWWAPRSMGVFLLSCETDLRAGGGYRFEIGRDATQAMVFFGKYLEVTPPQRLVWTNEESAAGPISTLTFTETAGRTLLVLNELYPSTEARDAALDGMEGAMAEMFTQLDVLLATLEARG